MVALVSCLLELLTEWKTTFQARFPRTRRSVSAVWGGYGSGLINPLEQISQENEETDFDCPDNGIGNQ